MDKRLNSGCVIQFAKLPQLGRVKTRMQPRLSEQQSKRLHEYLTERVFSSLCQPAVDSGPAWDFQLCVSAQPEDEFFQNLIAPMAQSVPVLPQVGSDLGERMSNALRLALEDYEYAIIVGSDCPFLEADHMRTLFQWLQEGSECVLIPAHDGGYVAIGCRRHLPQLFCNVDWGTERVFEQTVARLQQSSIAYRSALPLADIDRPEDLSLWPGLSRFAPR